jgi:Flp pilus assembly pilin Flp
LLSTPTEVVVNQNQSLRRHRESGAAALELALLLPILIVLMIGAVEFARMYQAWETLTHGAREAARPLALNTGDPVKTAEDNVPGLDKTELTVVRTPNSGNCTLGSTVTIVLTYPVVYNIPFFGSGTKTVTGKASMRCGG